MAFGEPFARDGAGRHAHGGFARRRAPAAAVVANAVFLPVRVVGVAGAKRFGDRRVVLAARILVPDQERDRRSRGPSFEHARQYFDRVGFAALRHMPRRARFAPVEVMLDVGDREREPRRAAVDDATDRRSMRFAEGGDAEQGAERVAGHGTPRIEGAYRRTVSSLACARSEPRRRREVVAQRRAWVSFPGLLPARPVAAATRNR